MEFNGLLNLFFCSISSLPQYTDQRDIMLYGYTAEDYKYMQTCTYSLHGSYYENSAHARVILGSGNGLVTRLSIYNEYASTSLLHYYSVLYSAQ